MGQDKAELLIDGRRMIDLVIESVSAQNSNILLSRPKAYHTNLPLIPDLEEGPKGPVAGIYAAYKWYETKGGEDGFFTAPVDAPALPTDLCEKLWSQEQSQFAAGPERTHPAFAWWRLQDLRESFEKMDFLQSNSLHDLVKICRSKSVTWNSEIPFFNINTPNDVREYLTFR